MLITGDNVYKYNGSLYIKVKARPYRGMILWQKIEKVFLIVYKKVGESFYLDDYGFEKL